MGLLRRRAPGPGALRGRLGLGLALLLGAAACGGIDDGGGGFGDIDGKVCYLDTDCVPNDCCGRGTGVVHVDDAPSCGGVVCDGSCPAGSVDCGCGLPYCADDGRCVVAYTVNEQCE